jgi:hypothetical protein
MWRSMVQTSEQALFDSPVSLPCEIKRVGERSAESREFPFPQGKLTEWVKIRINKVKAKIIDKINNSSNDRQPRSLGRLCEG